MKKITLLMLFAVLLLPWAMQAQSVKKDVIRNVTTQLVKTVSKANAAEPTATTAAIALTPGENNNGRSLRYREHLDNVGTPLSWGFDDSTLDGWTTIDADGDGFGWILGSTTGGIYHAEGVSLADAGHNNSHDLVISASYSNVYGVLTPDNYLVSPKVQLGGKITFWAKGQDANYCAEPFGVAVSTTSNSDPSHFTMVGEKKIATADWVQYEFDLSAYEGQEGYVAIRHYGISDMFILDVDDIEIRPAGSGSFNEFYLVGDFNNWGDGVEPLKFEEVEDGVFEAKVDLPAGDEFKVITYGDDDQAIWMGGTDETGIGYYLITNELLNVPTTLWVDAGSNFKMQEAAVYIVRITEAQTTGLKVISAPLQIEFIYYAPTGIYDINADKGQSNEWYNLNGQKLNGKPVVPGIYINGGRKVIVR